MSARTPRRSFASPFVITLAVAPACYTSPSAPPPEPQRPPVVANPPRPEPVEQAPAPQPNDRPPVIVNPPRPTPAPSADRAWTLIKQGTQCQAVAKIECPKPAPGHAMIACNPPPPVAYDCPEGVDLTTPRTIITVTNGCELDREPMKCPPKTMCNPPPPKAVPCPSR